MSAQVETEQNNRTFDDIMDVVANIGESTISKFADEVDRDARFPHEAFDALKAAKLLSAYVPRNLGGDGLNIVQICRICEKLGRYDASAAMIYAMHQIQVACILHHGQSSEERSR